jgi:hypothetical protein
MKTIQKTETFTSTQKLLNKILREVRYLRHEFELILPQDDLKEYAHPERIKRSYKKALGKYPPAV